MIEESSNRFAVACGAAVLIAAALGTGMAFAREEQRAEEKLVEEMFGRQITAARATASAGDDVQMAKQLMIAAYDGAFSEKLRLALARASMNVATAAGSKEGEEIARRALALIDKLQPHDPARKAALRRDLAVGELNQARRKGARRNKLEPLARRAIQAHLEFVRTVLDDTKQTGQAEKSIRTAKLLARTYRLSELKALIRKTERQLRRAKAKAIRLTEVMERLKAARLSQDATAIRAARIAAAQTHLEYDGDVQSAAEYLHGTADWREAAVAAAAAFLKDAKIDRAGSMETLEALIKLAQDLAPPARQRIAQTAKSMCQAYLAIRPPEPAAERAKLLLGQLQILLGQRTARISREQLAIAYGRLNCMLKVLDDQNVRVVYDFDDARQLNDWTAHSGAWNVSKEVLVCRTGRRRFGRCRHKLHFRADRPLKLAFDSRAKNSLAAQLLFYTWGSTEVARTDEFSIDSVSAAVRALGLSSSDKRHRLTETKLRHFEIVTDGKGGFAWSIDGILIHKHTPDAAKAVSLGGSFVVELRSRRSDRIPTTFDNVVIEAAVLPDPVWVPPEEKPAHIGSVGNDE